MHAEVGAPKSRETTMLIQVPDTTPVMAIFQFAHEIGCAAHYEDGNLVLRPTAEGQARTAVRQTMALPVGDSDRARHGEVQA